MRARKRAEERVARQDAKVAKEEQRKQEDLKSYKNIMRVRARQAAGRKSAADVASGGAPQGRKSAADVASG